MSAGWVVSSSSGSSTRTSGREFPPSIFKPSIFKGLSGSVVWFDGSGGLATVAKNATVFKDFTKLTGVSVKSDYNANGTKFFAAMQAHQVPWTNFEVTSVSVFLRAKKLGYLQRLDPKIVPLHLMVKGTADPYGYHAERYAAVITYSTKQFPSSGPHPTSLTDIFNTTKFPGKRCLYNYPEYAGNLEAALLADGVPRNHLYPLNVKRALSKLNEIKGDIVWYTDADQGVRLIAQGDCSLGIAFSGRVASAVTKSHEPVALSWNDAVYNDAVYSIPKGTKNLKAAEAMLAMWILDRKGQDGFLKMIPYPTPIKGYQGPASVRRWLPLGPNLKTAFTEDAAWYANNIDSITKQWNAWQQG